MRAGKSALSAIVLGAALGLALAASLPAAAGPNWGAVPSATMGQQQTGTKPNINPPTNLQNMTLSRAQLDCKVGLHLTSLVITNVSMASTPAGLSMITLCTPQSNLPCGPIGQMALPALAAGGSANLPLNYPFKSNTTCQAGTLQPTNVN